MASPFDFFGSVQKMLGSLQPPAWLVQEGQNRIILSLNHVLQQEPQAMERLAAQSGKSVLMTLAPSAAAKSMRPLNTSTASSRPRSMCEEKAKHLRPLASIQATVCRAWAGVKADSSKAPI